MSDMGNDPQLVHVLRDVLEGRGRPAQAGARRSPRRPAADRPRFGAIVVTSVLVTAGAAALALWPSITNHRAAQPAAPVAAQRGAGDGAPVAAAGAESTASQPAARPAE